MVLQRSCVFTIFTHKSYRLEIYFNIAIVSMRKSVTFGKRKITQVNYSRCVSLPKLMLQNMGIDVGDSIEFLAGNDGSYRLRPAKEAGAGA
jgi:hypothetical protein